MNTTFFSRWLCGGALLTALAILTVPSGPTSRGASADKEAARSEVTRKEIGKNVFFEKEGEQRRVIVVSTVVLNKGALEGLLTRKGTKEHEYILAADVDARNIHTALLVAGAKPGSPVKYQPKYAPAHGTAIKVTLRYEKDEKTVTVSAREWIRNANTKKDLDCDWVFGGSVFQPDPEDKDKPPQYLANQGDLICVCNMEPAMLDLPVRSPTPLDERVYVANPDRVPALETKVEVILEPVPEKPAKDK
jgi:hypothetical protein